MSSSELNHFQKQRPTIGFLIDIVESTYQTSLVKGVMRAAEHYGFNLMIFDGRPVNSPLCGQWRDYNTVFKLAGSKKLDALLVSGTLFSESSSVEATAVDLTKFKSIPLLSVGVKLPDIPVVRSESYESMKKAVLHLVEKHDYRKIAFVSGVKSSFDSAEKYRAYCDVLKEHQIELDPAIVYVKSNSPYTSEELTESIIRNNNIPFEALVFCGDSIALETLAMLKAKGFDIPRDFAVTGFDDYPQAYISVPSLTTVHQPISELGYQAVKILSDRLNGQEVPQETVLPCHLIIRESCGCFLNRSKRAKAVVVKQDEHPQDSAVDVKLQYSIEKKIVQEKETLILALLKACEGMGFIEKDLRNAFSALLDMIAFDLKGAGPVPISPIIINDWLENTIGWESFLEVWTNCILILRDKIGELLPEIADNTQFEALFRQYLTHLARWSETRASQKLEKIYHFVRSIPYTIGQINKASSLKDINAELLRKISEIGFQKCFLSLYQKGPLSLEEAEKSQNMQLEAGQDEKGLIDLKGKSQHYPAEDIIPEGLVQNSLFYRLIWMELFYDGLHFGYIGLSLLDISPVVYYLIREQVSLALYHKEMIRRQQEG